MREVRAELRAWWEADVPFALATIAATDGSAPRGVGAVMGVTADGQVVGSLSGGCVEGAVVQSCQAVLAGESSRSERFGWSEATAFAVGLTCGGVIEVWVERIDAERVPWWGQVLEALGEDRPVAVATVLEGAHAGRKRLVTPDATEGSTGASGLDVAVTDDARGQLAHGTSAVRRYGPDGQRRVDEVGVLVHAMAPRPRMHVFGAIDFAAAMVRTGTLLGYHVTVCDARELFATRARFPEADEVVVAWPHRWLAKQEVDPRTVICVLTHDPKFDVPLLEVALRTPAGYVGAMGSRRTHDERLASLRERGLTDEELARLRSPIGLDLGARTPEETAVSIAAEIVQVRWGGSGRPLARTEGRIHGRVEPS